MASPIRIIATIEGALNQWVTCNIDAGSGTNGRTLRSGLSYDGITVAEQSDIRGGKFEADALTLSIVATPEANDEFSRSPTLLTYLSASVTSVGATTFNVRSNALIATNDYVQIGTECVQVTNRASLALTVTRALRDTIAQIHVRTDGENASEVPIWSKVQAWEGRRVVITATEFGATSNVMRGVITQAPYLNADGTKWLIGVDSIAKTLEQEVGEPVDAVAGILGIRYGASSAFGMVLEYDEQFMLTGFYETESAFLTALNAELAAVTISGVDSIWASFVNDPSHGRCVQLWIDVGGADIDVPNLTIGSQIDGAFSSRSGTSAFRTTVNGVPFDRPELRTDLKANTTYTAVIVPTMSEPSGVGVAAARQGLWGTIPRTMIHGMRSLRGAIPPFYDRTATADDVADASIVFDQDIGAQAGDVITLSSPSTLTEPLRLTILGTFGTNGFTFYPPSDLVDDYCSRNNLTAIFLGADTKITFTKDLGKGDLSDFMDAITTAAPYANTGAVPYITSEDANTSAAIVATATRGIPALTTRNYNVDEPVSVADILSPELLLLGLMLTTDTDGKLSFVPFDVPTVTTPVVATFDGGTVATPSGDVGMWPGWMPATDGIVSIVELIGSKSVGGDSVSTRAVFGGMARARSVSALRDPAAFIYRDIASVSAHKNRGPNTMTIEPEVTAAVDLTYTEAVDIASRIVAFFGQPYEVVTIKVRRTQISLDVRCGDVIGITSPHVPNSGDGTRGVSARRAIVIGRTVPYDPANGAETITFEAVMHADTTSGDGGANNIAGYAGSMTISGAAPVSGNTWDLVVDSSSFAPSGSWDSDFFQVGDYVTAIEYNTASPGTQTGTIVSITATTIVRVAFGGAAPWGVSYSGAYYVDFSDVSAGMTDAQDDYCYTADSGLLLSNGNPARVLA